MITRLLFGVTIKSGQRIQWDSTTLVLKTCLLRRTRPGHAVLEVGTGPYAILSILLAKRATSNVTACDINEAYVRNARKTVALNSVSVQVVHSDLFENIHNTFDIIFFNSVYIPRMIGKKLGIDRIHERDTDWCGGETGLETIQRFLWEASSHLREHGQILLGFNSEYLHEDLVTTLCHTHGYTLKAQYVSFPNPSKVFVLERKLP